MNRFYKLLLRKINSIIFIKSRKALLFVIPSTVSEALARSSFTWDLARHSYIALSVTSTFCINKPSDKILNLQQYYHEAEL